MKETLKQLGKSYAAVAQSVGVSTAALCQIANHGIWPKRNPEKLRQALIKYFNEKGAAIPECLLQRQDAAPAQTQLISEDESMLLRKATLTQEARKAFGLFKDPFNEEIHSAEDVFASADIKYVREAMYQTAAHGGFIAVVGESGAGKSTLREDLQDRISRSNTPVIMIEPYVLAMEDNDIKGKTLKASHIAEAILEAVASGTNPKRSPEVRFRQVHKALQESAKAGNKHVLVIEEAHGMPIPTLKHLKRFFELKQGFDRLIGIVLIGQTELAQKLSENNPAVREVVQRCELVTLQPLTDGKLRDYLKFKFERVGKNWNEVLNDSALDAIAQRLNQRQRVAKGTIETSLLYPLAVNNLVSAAINQAAELGFDIVDADIVQGV